jgi:hypothetical protein
VTLQIPKKPGVAQLPPAPHVDFSQQTPSAQYPLLQSVGAAQLKPSPTTDEQVDPVQ